jgi:hypothetical protein
MEAMRSNMIPIFTIPPDECINCDAVYCTECEVYLNDVEYLEDLGRDHERYDDMDELWF